MFQVYQSTSPWLPTACLLDGAKLKRSQRMHARWLRCACWVGVTCLAHVGKNPKKCFKLGSKILSVVRVCCLVINHFHTDCLMQKGCRARRRAGQLKSLPYVTQAKGRGRAREKGDYKLKSASRDSLFCSTSASAGEGREMLHRHKLGEHSELIIKRQDITRRAYESS